MKAMLELGDSLADQKGMAMTKRTQGFSIQCHSATNAAYESMTGLEQGDR